MKTSSFSSSPTSPAEALTRSRESLFSGQGQQFPSIVENSTCQRWRRLRHSSAEQHFSTFAQRRVLLTLQPTHASAALTERTGVAQLWHRCYNCHSQLLLGILGSALGFVAETNSLCSEWTRLVNLSLLPASIKVLRVLL